MKALLRKLVRWLRIAEPDPYDNEKPGLIITQSSVVPATRESTPANEWNEFIIPIFTYGCPDCGSEQFMQGPEGGACTNMMCARCHSRFNYCWPMGTAHRIENGDDPSKRNPDYHTPIKLVV